MSASAIVYLILCAVLGVASLGCAIYQRNKLSASASWPRTTGTLTEAKLVENKSSDSADYKVVVVYQYMVDGQNYTGKRLAFGPHSFIRKKSAQKLLEKYQANSSVEVYFNPQNPRDAVLSREAPYGTFYLVLGVAALIFVAAVVFFSRGRN